MTAAFVYLAGLAACGWLYYSFFTTHFERKPMSETDLNRQRVFDTIFLILACVMWPLSLPVFFLSTVPFFIVRGFRWILQKQSNGL
jgi:hypothetical protein